MPERGGFEKALGFDDVLSGLVAGSEQAPAKEKTPGKTPGREKDIEVLRAKIAEYLAEFAMAQGGSEADVGQLMEQVQQMPDKEVRRFFNKLMDGFEDKTKPVR